MPEEFQSLVLHKVGLALFHPANRPINFLKSFFFLIRLELGLRLGVWVSYIAI
jgi:hypothetical protein